MQHLPCSNLIVCRTLTGLHLSNLKEVVSFISATVTLQINGLLGIAGTERNLYCTLDNPQHERLIEIKLCSFIICGELHATTLYVVHLFERLCASLVDSLPANKISSFPMFP